MGVLSFGNGFPVWQGGARIIVALVAHAIRTSGPRHYLRVFLQNFEQGYNHVDLSTIGREQRAEFRAAVVDYRALRLWETEGLPDCDRLLGDLLALIDGYERARAER